MYLLELNMYFLVRNLICFLYYKKAIRQRRISAGNNEGNDEESKDNNEFSGDDTKMKMEKARSDHRRKLAKKGLIFIEKNKNRT